MPTVDTSPRPRRRGLILDVTLLLLVSFLAEGAHFAQKQGRIVINGDSAQHIDGAESLLSPEMAPNFGMRKPGYTLILAGVGALTGNMSWSASVTNHVLLALLPVAVFGLGFNLHSRTAGWIAALIAIAQLQKSSWGLTIMSEASYTCFMTYGLLVLAVGLGRKRVVAWMLGAGMLLACAWLIRAVAVAVIVAAIGCVLWKWVKADRRKAILACACLTLPVVGAFLVECGLNYRSAGQFRPSTGSMGIMLMTRARYLQGSPLPDTETTRWLVDLIPERPPIDAYRANHLDGCVARGRAIRELGMDEWAFDARIRRAGLETLAADPVGYVKTGAVIFVRHLLRQIGGPSVSDVAPHDRKPIIGHEAAPDFRTSQDDWFAYWFVPHRSIEESTQLVHRMRVASQQRAPFGQSGIWADLRYIGMLPLTDDVLGVLRAVGSLWPGFALIFLVALGLNRTTCALIITAYILDALIVAAFGSTDIANGRYQFVWFATDTALVGCLVTPVVRAAWARVGLRRAEPEATPAGVSVSQARACGTDPAPTDP